MLSIPSKQSPFDEKGENFFVGQRGPVYFLVGVLDKSGKATRSISITEDKALFFPVLNSVFTADTGIESKTADELKKMKDAVKDDMDNVRDLSLDVDGISLQKIQKKFRTKTYKLFSLTVPDGNLFDSTASPFPAGIYYPNVENGYYVMLKPLSAGDHVIHIKGTSVKADPANNFSLDVTYNVKVIALPAQK